MTEPGRGDEWRRAVMWLAEVARGRCPSGNNLYFHPDIYAKPPVGMLFGGVVAGIPQQATEKQLRNAMAACQREQAAELPLLLIDMSYDKGKQGLLITEQHLCLFDSGGFFRRPALTVIPARTLYSVHVDDVKASVTINGKHHFAFFGDSRPTMLAFAEALRRVIEAYWDSVDRPAFSDEQVDADLKMAREGNVGSWLGRYKGMIQNADQPIVSLYDFWHPAIPRLKTQGAAYGLSLVWEAAIHLTCAQHSKISCRIIRNLIGETVVPMFDDRLWAHDSDKSKLEKPFDPIPCWPTSAMKAINLGYQALDFVDSGMQRTIEKLIAAARTEERVTRPEAERGQGYRQEDQHILGDKYIERSQYALMHSSATSKDVLACVRNIADPSGLMRLFE